MPTSFPDRVTKRRQHQRIVVVVIWVRCIVFSSVLPRAVVFVISSISQLSVIMHFIFSISSLTSTFLPSATYFRRHDIALVVPKEPLKIPTNQLPSDVIVLSFVLSVLGNRLYSTTDCSDRRLRVPAVRVCIMGIDRRAGRDHQATILTRGTRSDVHISGLTEQQSCSSYTSGDIACLLDISVLVYSATSKAAGSDGRRRM